MKTRQVSFFEETGVRVPEVIRNIIANYLKSNIRWKVATGKIDIHNIKFDEC